LESEEEEDEERIALVMSSFFAIYEGESEEKDNVGTILAAADIALSVVSTTILGGLKVDLATTIVTPSTIVAVEEKIGSSKPAIAEEKGKGHARNEEGLRRPLKMTHALAKGPSIKNLVAESTRFIRRLGRQ
jgi:hypothetical protein